MLFLLDSTNKVGIVNKGKNSPGLPIPTSPHSYDLDVENEDSAEELSQPSTSHNPDFKETNDKPHRLRQAESSDLIRDLHLSKDKAELPGSRLQQCNLLQ